MENAPRIESSSLPVVAIVGRANVGKSTLWNRIIEEKRAIVSDEPHTTRDRNAATAYWRGTPFTVVDTGGLDTESDEIGEGIRRQAELAIKTADVILFLVDAKTGVLPDDLVIAKTLRKVSDRVIVLLNKVDGPRDMAMAAESRARSLGLGEAVSVSAATGSGIGDALDAVFELLGRREQGAGRKGGKKSLKKENIEETEADLSEETSSSPFLTSDALPPLHIVLIGRPNVGKSSLTNAILGEERVIVSAIPHTTREPQDTAFTYRDREIVLIDTAGMRRRSNISGDIEEEAMVRNREALDRADVAVLVLDATEGASAQDKLLAGLIVESGKGLAIVVNKWDLVADKTTMSAKEAEDALRREIPFVDWAPAIFASAKTKRNAKDVLDLALLIEEERKREIAYNAINRILKSVIKARRPLQRLGPKSPYIYDIAQVGTEPPEFLITVRGQRVSLAPAWLKFLERRIRETFGFAGTPIVVKASVVPMAKAERAHNLRGPGMDEVSE